MAILAPALHAYRRHVSLVRGVMAWLASLLSHWLRAAAACALPLERRSAREKRRHDAAPSGERVLPGVPPSRDWLAVDLAPPPELAAGAADAFTFRSVRFAPPPGRPARVALTPDTTAATLLDFCAAWLRVPAESLSIAGGALVLSTAMPRRTAAEAGLGADVAGRDVPLRRIFALPWCAICLGAATGAVWSCRGGMGGAHSVRHSFSDGCAKRYAATVISVRSAATLRCPVPGCAHTLLSSAELAALVDVAALARLRAARTAQHAARLRAVLAGAEVRYIARDCHVSSDALLLTWHADVALRQGTELASMLARGEACACPACAVLIQKGGGCRHMHCSVCGEDFEWE